MITGELKNKVDRLWQEFWTGGIANPLTVIEQITYLMFCRLLDMRETLDEKSALRSGLVFNHRFAKDKQDLRWQHFRNLPAEAMLETVRDKVFPHFKSLAVEASGFGDFMKDAQFMVQKPSLLVSAVNMIDQLPLGDADTKGDLYEYLLSKLTTAGVNGQFRTPRHIIRMIIELMNPDAKEVIADPACGTGGFLAGTMEYLLEKYTSPEMIEENEEGQKIYCGDLLAPHREHINRNMFHGFEFDSTMLRIAAMNMLLHGVEEANVRYQDSLSGSFKERFPYEAENAFDLILANPPFKGSLDFEDVSSDLLLEVKTKKTELLFVALILRMLKLGGRSATIVPDGVLFGSSKAHQSLRQKLLDENQLEAVISLPPNVFKPYAGVSTGVLVFTKGGKTDQVFFYDVEADGFSLDDKRQKVDDNDLPDVVCQWSEYDKLRQKSIERFSDRTKKAFVVRANEIRKQEYDFSINRYKETKHVQVKYDQPIDILDQLDEFEIDIQLNLKELRSML